MQNKKGILRPDFRFKHFSEITVEFLKEKNIRTILSDLDATLAPQDELGDEKCDQWIKNLLDNEISLIIVSNNSQERVDEFTKKFNLVGYGKCGKPSTEKINKNLVDKGLNIETTMFLGDQIFTDLLCGQKLGVKTALVDYIEGKEHLGLVLKRKAEKIIKQSWEW